MRNIVILAAVLFLLGGCSPQQESTGNSQQKKNKTSAEQKSSLPMVANLRTQAAQERENIRQLEKIAHALKRKKTHEKL